MTVQIREPVGWAALLLSQLSRLWHSWPGQPHDPEIRAGVEADHAHGVYGVLGEGYGAGNGNPHEPR